MILLSLAYSDVPGVACRARAATALLLNLRQYHVIKPKTPRAAGTHGAGAKPWSTEAARDQIEPAAYGILIIDITLLF